MANLQGKCDTRFDAVRAALEENAYTDLICL